MTVGMLDELQNRILPNHYRCDLSEKMDDGYLLFKNRAYLAMAMPFKDVPEGDYRSEKAKKMIRSVMTCIPVLFEKGLFLIYYGDDQAWGDKAHQFEVDKAALRPVILQSIHFIDPMTGKNVNSRTHWGPLKFGFCASLIDDIEGMAEGIQQADSDNVMSHH